MSYRLRVENLREAAREKGDRSGYAIARRTGLSEPTVSKLLRGTALPGLKALLMFDRAYGMTPDDLIEEVAA
ncbi:helix-turn-helix domain-containing protein [Streptomyces xanthophaeus]|uniref:helix-turn-helix domain-containing protein n=1 Tax=Streptomyces xanthophaeus TaxID=67385 RepID=UPI00264A287D|nr:helix-turn-helix transcriptional regulator [Streptomyces xanthophaeus]WKD36563.1 helix-turn-helix transcriptional regulator [Streptomyces xanthophaeus]